MLPLVVSGPEQATYVNSRQRRCTELCQVASFCKGPSFSAPEAVTGVIAIASLPLRADDREYSPLRILKDTPLVNKSESFFCLLGAIVALKTRIYVESKPPRAQQGKDQALCRKKEKTGVVSFFLVAPPG